MSLRLEMLQVARLAPRQLGDARDTVAAFLQGRLSPDGGALDRSGKSDLYYTPFLLDGLIALRDPLPIGRTRPYLEGFGAGDDLDLVHVACLVRAWAALGEGVPEPLAAHAATSLEALRAKDGGYGAKPGAETGTLYNAFLALGTYQDMGQKLPEPDRVAASIEGLLCDDGGYADSFGLPFGTTPTTAAAIALLRQLDHKVPERTCAWLLQQTHPQGGFLAMPQAPIPDLLSTATALHALSAVGVPFDGIREPMLDFLDSLWTGTAFVANWEEDDVDCEYAFYALLALGHLST